MLYLREVDKCLALVCLINQSEIHRQHLINYNIDRFKEGLKNIFSHSANMRNVFAQHQLTAGNNNKDKDAAAAGNNNATRQ